MASTGALTQLGALGAQDQYTICGARHSLWKGGFTKITNYANAEIEQTASSGVGYNKTINFKIERNGDLIKDIYFKWTNAAITPNPALVVTSPNTSYAHYSNSIGHAVIDWASVTIGGHEFDKQTGEYMEMLEELFATSEKRLREEIGYSETVQGLIDFARRSHVIYSPLKFWFNRFTEQAYPLIASQYHEMYIKIKTKALNEVAIESGDYINNTNLTNGAYGALPTLDDAVLLCRYVFLDTEERRMFAAQQHEYLFDQVQDSDEITHNSGTANQQIRVNFNHPTKELLWRGRRDTVVQPGVAYRGNDWFNYSGVQSSFETYPGSGIFVPLENDPLLTTQITVNGHERTPVHPSLYYRNIQPLQHHTSKPNKHIYNYCFAEMPEDWKPTGSINFSRIDNTMFKITFPTGGLDWAGQVRIYARNLNVMKIVSGMAGMLFAN